MIDPISLSMGAMLFASPIRVRDDVAMMAAGLDTSFHAVSRTPSSPLGASDSLPTPVLTLPTVEVSRDRALRAARRRLPTAFVSDLRAGAANRALESTSELLASSASVRVVQYGGLGAFSTVSLRGAPPGQVAVYLDGAPLTSAAHGTMDVSDLPSTLVERIEVYRGMSPLGLGSATPGGAVNLVTADAAHVRSLRLATGSFGTHEARGTLADSRGAWSAFAHFGYQGSRGDFDYFDDNGTPQNLVDDSVSVRRNARFDALASLARIAWAPRPGIRLATLADVFHKAQGMPGLGATPALHPRLSFQRERYALDAVVAPTERWPGLSVRSDVQRERSRFRDTEGELGLGRQDTDERFRHSGLHTELRTPEAWPWLIARIGGAYRDEYATPSPITQGLPVPPPSTRRTRSAFVTVQLLPLGDRITLHVGRRWDRQDDHLRSSIVGGGITRRDVVRELDSPQIGTRVQLPFGLEVRGNASRSQRAPDFLELFGNQGSVLGNATLQPERGESWDAGGAWSRQGRDWEASIEWGHHQAVLEQLILFQRNSQSSVRALNAGEATLRGEEASGRFRWHGIAISAERSWLSALETSAGIYRGRRLPQRSEQQGSLRLDVSHGRWRASTDLQHLSDDFEDRINFRRVPARTLLGAAVSARVGPGRATLEGKNLANRRVEDVGGFPLPGRSVFVSIEMDPARGSH